MLPFSRGKAEIESNSTVAFIEKNVKRDWQGTTIILKVKEKYRFSELKNYINTYFRYPSVEIQLVNVDILDSYIDKDIIFNDKIIQIIEKANHQRNEILSDFLPDRQCLNKLRKILLKNENKKEVLSKIYDVLDNVFHKSYVKENLLDYIRKTEQMNDCINLVRKEVDREIEESEEKIEKYPGFLTVLCQLDLEKTVGYNQLIFEMDNTFDIKEVYKEKKKDSSDRGILFVFTDFADYDLGIEWHSVNAFLFQKNKIVSNFVKFETDLSEESDRNIFSLEEITNADYEISEKLHEPEMEEYYEEYFGGDNEEFYDKNDKLLTYRDDRKHTYLCMQDGMNDSFLSTSFVADRKPLADGSSNYFQKKDGLVLMDVEALDTLEHVDMNDVLGDQSMYPDENEVLYPPFLYLDTELLLLTSEEEQLRDIHGNPPYGKVHVMLKGSTIVVQDLTEEEKEELEKCRDKLIAPKEIANIKIVWNAIRNEEESKYPKEIAQYCRWKERLRLYLRERYVQIKYDVLNAGKQSVGKQMNWERAQMFLDDLKERTDEANNKREKYENELKWINMAEIITGGIAGFFFSLNMLGYVSISCKDLSVDSRVIALLFTFLCIGLAAACKTLSLKDKLRQRTIEFLDYDKLQNDWTYEKEKTEDKLERYIRRMRQIEEQDNKRCLQYTDRMIRNMSEWEEKVEKIKGGDSKK